MARQIKKLITVLALIFMSLYQVEAQSYHSLYDNAFTQDWLNTNLIFTNDVWSGVPSIQGFLGDDAAGSTSVDPQTVLKSFVTLDVIANATNPNTNTTGGVAEFVIADPVIALQASGNADFPNIVLYINTTKCSKIRLQYDLRDIDGSGDNSIQQVALQYRNGATGNFINIPEGYVYDASTGPNLATLVTHIDLVLPSACNNQPELQLRIISSNAIGNDEWIGIDNIIVANGGDVTAPKLTFNPENGSLGVPANVHPVIVFDEPIQLTDSSEINTGNIKSVISEVYDSTTNTKRSYSATIDTSKTIITVIPDQNLNYRWKYNIMIESVQDSSGNKTPRQSYSFTIDAPPSTYRTDTIIACDSLTWIDGITYKENNTTATYTLVGGNYMGGDSIITLNLSITKIDSTVSVNSNTITSNQEGATYKWLDCNNGFVVISSETAKSFTPIVNGNYAVEVTLGSCVVRSACVTINKTGVLEPITAEKYNVFPNPSNGIITIQSAPGYANRSIGEVTIYNIIGKKVYTCKNIDLHHKTIDLSGISEGVYFITISSGGNIYSKKFIIQ